MLEGMTASHYLYDEVRSPLSKSRPTVRLTLRRSRRLGSPPTPPERASTTGTRNATNLDASPAPRLPRGCGGPTLGGPYNSARSAPSMAHRIKRVGDMSPMLKQRYPATARCCTMG